MYAMDRRVALAALLATACVYERNPEFGEGELPGMNLPGSASESGSGDASETSGPASEDLLLWLRFDEADITLDSSAFGHTLNCAPSGCPISSTGRVGNAAEFDGTTYLELPSSSLFHTGEFTLSTWVQPLSSGRLQMLLAWPFAAGTHAAWQLMYDSDGQIVFGMGPETSATFLAGPTGMNPWVHTVCTWSGDTMCLYIDADRIECKPYAVFDPDASPILIGGDINDGTYVHLANLGLDDVRIYGRALSASEVANLYAGADP